MKGMASAVPNASPIRVSGRSARKHYGIVSHKKFDPNVHDPSRKYALFLHDFHVNLVSEALSRFWDDFTKTDRVDTIDWFV